MNDSWTQRWDDRYSSEEFAYGVEPNAYLKQQLEKLRPGAILFPAEGEGRNAVFAAKLGWQVSAFDISAEGRKKALRLAEANNVKIDYLVSDLSGLTYVPEQFDVIALIFAHFPAEMKSAAHKTLEKFLKPGGVVIFEAFSKRHLEYLAVNEKVGGPKDINQLFSLDEIKADFPNYEIIELAETEVELNEGQFHNGRGSVIRFVGRKR